MSFDEYLRLMGFPTEWREWEMLPPADHIQNAIDSLEPGMEGAAEHDRHGFFNYWLKRTPTKDQLIRLMRLSYLDSDQLMAGHVRSRIARAKNADADALAVRPETYT